MGLDMIQFQKYRHVSLKKRMEFFKETTPLGTKLDPLYLSSAAKYPKARAFSTQSCRFKEKIQSSDRPSCYPCELNCISAKTTKEKKRKKMLSIKSSHVMNISPRSSEFCSNQLERIPYSFSKFRLRLGASGAHPPVLGLL